jgi:hypothetical protein
LPAEVFPSEVRAAGQGFAAGCAKLAAACGVFLFPILQGAIDNSALLYIIAGGCRLGLLITALFGIEPKGRSLQDISAAALVPLAERRWTRQRRARLHPQPRLRNPGARRDRQLLRALDQQHQIVRIAVRPVLAGLNGGDDRVPSQLRVRGRVPVW